MCVPYSGESAAKEPQASRRRDEDHWARRDEAT